MSIATLPPLLEGEWVSVREAISAQLKQMSETDYKMEFEVYENSGEPSIYAQASLDLEGAYLVEIESNEFLEDKLNAREVQVMRVLGWQQPTDGIPNFWRTCPVHWDKDLIATLIVQALIRTDRLHKDSWFSFGTDAFGVQLSESGAFWKHIDNPRVLCLMGSNTPKSVPVNQ